MSKSEVVLKAKQLNEACDCDGVVELLREYVKENPDDLEALALFQKHFVLKTIVDLNLNCEELSSNDGKNIFNSIPEESVLKISEMIFMGLVSNIYLSEHSEEDKGKLLFVELKRVISSLGERLEDYNVLKNQLEKFFEIQSALEYGKYFYNNLVGIIDWKSKVSENILKFLVEKAKLNFSVASEEEIYDTYTKNMKQPLCSFEDKPYLRGERLVNEKIKSEEEKEFWKGYFALMKKIREEEYEGYQKIASDEKHPLYGLLTIEKEIEESYLNACMAHLITTEDIVKMKGAANYFTRIGFSESDFKSKIEEAEQSFNTVRVNPIELIKSKISKLFGK